MTTTNTSIQPTRPLTDLRVIVPVTGADDSSAAVDYAARFPWKDVTLLHVVDASWASDVRHGKVEQLAEQLRENRIETRTRLAEGDVAKSIIEAGRDADLVIMATHARGGIARAMLGSVADEVYRTGDTPVMVLRLGEVPQSLTLPERIVVPLDGSPRAEQALPLARSFAEALGVPVHLIRAITLSDVVDVLHEGGPSTVPTPQILAKDESRYDAASGQAETISQNYLDQIAQSGALSGLTVTTELLHGTPAVLLPDAARPTDLIVMTSHGERGYRRLIVGSVAEKLVREASAPVVIVPSHE